MIRGQERRGIELGLNQAPNTVTIQIVEKDRRDENISLIHEDIPVTDSLTAVLDKLDWSIPTVGLIAPGKDPLEEINAAF